jgi:polygalacturonase
MLLSTMSFLFWTAFSLPAQDTRLVKEPTFPPICARIQASLETTPDGKLISSSDNDVTSAAQTKQLESALAHCYVGQAVELTIGASSRKDAFLVEPIDIPDGVSLVVDGGITLFGSRNPAQY